MRDLFARVGAWCVERPAPVIALVVLLTIVGGVGALSLEPDGEAETLVDRGSETFQATEELKEKFGDDAVVVLVRGDLERLMLTEELGKILLLESCLAGTVSTDEIAEGIPTPQACSDLAQERPAKVVYGPATFLNQFAQQAERLLGESSQAAVVQARVANRRAVRDALQRGLSEEEAKLLGEQAAQVVLSDFSNQALGLASQYGLTGIPRIDDPTFVANVIFDNSKGDGVPKSKFAYLWPSEDSALVSVRLRSDLSESERADAIDLIRAAVFDPAFRPRGGSFLVSGVPVVVDGLTDELTGEIVLLLIAAVIVMALVLSLVFAPPMRLLPLAIALAAGAIAFGLLALFGGSLTMASIAGLPVLIGLAVDYAIQLQARFGEARSSGASPVRAAGEAAAKGGPVIATACLASAAGFTVLLLSPIPMVRSFGMLLVVGVVVALVLALTAGLALLSMTTREGSGHTTSRSSGALAGLRRASAPFEGMLRRTSSISQRVRAAMTTLGERALATAIAIPGRVLVAATVLALAGWIAGTRTEIVSDFRQLVPASLPALQDVDALEEETGVSGQLDVSVTADDITDPAVVAWMADLRSRVLAQGADEQFPSCRDPESDVCPAISLPDLFGTGEAIPDQERIRALLELLPPYFAQAVVETDPVSGEIGNTAVLSFGIPVMPFDEQKELIDGIRDKIDPPGATSDAPPGVDAEVVGLPVLVADANASLSSNRYLLTIAGLLAVALALFAVYRSVSRTVIPLVPVVLAPGWSALVLEAADVPLNPMSATLGALVIAISTEFSVLLSARYHSERESGASVGEALRLTYSRTGAAVMASAATAIAGFAVLALAAPIQALFGGDAIRMLTEFGLVAVIDLMVALAGVLFVLPAVLVWAEGETALALGERMRGRLRGPARANA